VVFRVTGKNRIMVYRPKDDADRSWRRSGINRRVVACPRRGPGTTKAAPVTTAAQMSRLILKRAPIGWNQDDYDVLCNGVLVGRIFLSPAAPEATPWMWTIGYNHHKNHTPSYGYEPTREASMAAFAKSWRRE
jgi:hypothetical protein